MDVAPMPLLAFHNSSKKFVRIDMELYKEFHPVVYCHVNAELYLGFLIKKIETSFICLAKYEV